MNREVLAQWYLRLNGFMTILNFVLHPRRRGGQRTDADIVGVRFPHRAEFPEGSDSDEAVFAAARKPLLLIAEVTRAECKLNGPWTKPASGNVNAVLAALGVFPLEEIPLVARELYQNGRTDQPTMICSLFCIGNAPSSTVRSQFPAVPQATWAEVLSFIWRRFRAHRAIKTDISQWDETGQQLWRLSSLAGDEFDTTIRHECQLPAAGSSSCR